MGKHYEIGTEQFHPDAFFVCCLFYILTTTALVSCSPGSCLPGSYCKAPPAPQQHYLVHSKLCSTLCHPMDCSPPGSSVHGNFQAGILELVAIFFLQGICHRPPNKTQDHQLRIGRSKNQERLTKICLDSPGRWTGTRDFCCPKFLDPYRV